MALEEWGIRTYCLMNGVRLSQVFVYGSMACTITLEILQSTFFSHAAVFLSHICRVVR